MTPDQERKFDSLLAKCVFGEGDDSKIKEFVNRLPSYVEGYSMGFLEGMRVERDKWIQTANSNALSVRIIARGDDKMESIQRSFTFELIKQSNFKLIGLEINELLAKIFTGKIISDLIEGK